MDSYTSRRIGLRARWRESIGLWRVRSRDAGARVQDLIGRAEECRAALKAAYGFDLSGRRILDVGPGQFLIQTRYFALQNDVVAIDAEVIAERLTPRRFFEMTRRNGLARAGKVLARKVLGVDRSYVRALRRALGASELPRVDVRRGDISQMPFEDASFDVIYSRAVLHHVRNPGAALAEMARVLRPGGVAHVDLHLYSSFNGSLDSRVMFSGDTSLYWAHLQGGGLVVEGAYLNKLRLDQWRALFAAEWPNSKLSAVESEEPALGERADRLLAGGLIIGYSREELLTTTLVAIWQKGLDCGMRRAIFVAAGS